jgi:DNA-directed RNA polymerase II subunit RPB1
LDPHEVWFHAVSGREGLIDTAIKTSQTGYIQRRFMKALENIIIHWDGSARNSDESIVQFKYGDDGFDAMRVENQYVDIWEAPTIEKYGSNAEEFCQLEEDHAFLHDINKWRDNGSKDTAYFQLPIPVDRIINNARTLFSFPSRKISTNEALTMINGLLETIDNDMLKILIRCKLSSYRIVHEYELSLDEIENIIHKIKLEYDVIKAVAGESVGAIAAQSIGEPATQMTLNTFHFAGVSSMNVTLGVPRLEELINCTKSDKMKTPSSIIHTDDPDKIIKQLKHVRFEDLVNKMKITKQPDKEEVKWFHIFPDQDYVAHQPERETLVIYLKEWYDVFAIKESMDTSKVTCEYTDGPTPIFHIQLQNDNDIGLFYEQHIRKATIRGIEGAEETIKVKPPGAKKYHVETSLSNLKKIIQLEDIDFSSINTNDIHAVARQYGIEAARGTLIREIRQILSYYGIYVNMRHITLAVDWMTWIGQLTPLTRHGIRKMDTSPLKRCTFEEVVDVFNQAACSKEVDGLSGVSECIITGAPPKLGTNVVGTMIDEGVIEKYKVPFPVEQSMFTSKWQEEDNPWISMDDEKDIYGGIPGQQVDPWADERQPWEVQQTMPFGQPPMLQPFGQPPMLQPFGQPPMLQPFGFQQPPTLGFQNPILPGMQAQPVALPSAQMFAPVQAPFVPTSPTYDPNRPPSPVYDPNRPMSPAYDPLNPPQSPRTPPDSPMAPAYGEETPTSPAYRPDTPPGSPMSPCYSPTSPGYDGVAPVYDPAFVVEEPQNKRRRTYC